MDALECVHEQKLPYSSALVTLINGETAEKRGPHHGIRRKPPDHVRRQIAKVNAERGERIIAEDGFR